MTYLTKEEVVKAQGFCGKLRAVGQALNEAVQSQTVAGGLLIEAAMEIESLVERVQADLRLTR